MLQTVSDPQIPRDPASTERALRESEMRFRQLAENIGAVFFMTEGTTESNPGRLLYVSPAYERIWGCPREALYEQPRLWMEAVHPDDRNQVEEALRGISRGEFDEEFRIVRPDGEVRWVRSRAFPVYNENGEPYRNAGLAEDVTERRLADQELRRAKQAAEEANRAKDQFLATLSHELRTPLTPVLAVVSSLEMDPRLPPELRGPLAMVRRNVELEARLIDDLLDLTRISRGKLELHREITDVRPVLEHAIQVCSSREVAAGRIRLETDLAAPSHRIWADSSRLSQVLWNLLNNAVKFTPPGGSIAVRTREEAVGQLAIEIADTGIGIEPDVLPRIFDAFEQADRRITRQFGGLGLGLAVSKAIIEMHGGSLTAASEGAGLGATFTIRLPASDPLGVLDDSGAWRSSRFRPAEKGSLAPALSRLFHILLVEDHADTAEAMADLLRDRGYRITVAGTVAGALEEARRAAAGEDGIDLVVSDLGLPDGTGLELMRELAGRYSLRGIALSGYGMEEDVRRSREAGFGRHLTKPVNFQALESAIRQALSEEM